MSRDNSPINALALLLPLYCSIPSIDSLHALSGCEQTVTCRYACPMQVPRRCPLQSSQLKIVAMVSGVVVERRHFQNPSSGSIIGNLDECRTRVNLPVKN